MRYTEHHIPALGPAGSALLLGLAETRRTLFRPADAQAVLGLSAHATHERLSYLAKRGWIQRLARGLYLIVPIEAGTKRTWNEDPALIASYLAVPSYLSFWSALHFHSLTEQVSRIVTVAARRPHAPVDVLGLRYLFTTLSQRKFFGFEPTWIRHHQVPIATPEKAILDSLDHPDQAGGVSEVAKALLALAPRIDEKRLLKNLVRMRQGAVAKRLGFLLEILEIAPKLVPAVKKHITAGYSLLDCSRGQRGRYMRRWNLRLNVSAEDILSGMGT